MSLNLYRYFMLLTVFENAALVIWPDSSGLYNVPVCATKMALDFSVNDFTMNLHVGILEISRYLLAEMAYSSVHL